MQHGVSGTGTAALIVYDNYVSGLLSLLRQKKILPQDDSLDSHPEATLRRWPTRNPESTRNVPLSRIPAEYLGAVPATPRVRQRPLP